MNSFMQNPMPVKQLSIEDRAFYRGILIGLQHISGHGYDVLYRELIREAGPKSVVAVAKEEHALEWSGLIKYKWCDKNGRYTPNRALQ